MKLLESSHSNFWKRLRVFCAGSDTPLHIRQAVSLILAEVKARGDSAMLKHMKRIDGVSLKAEQLRVSKEELQASAEQLDSSHRKAIRQAIRNVREFHRHGLPDDWTDRNSHGALVGERFYPVERVGLYIPGGQVPLVSTVIMTATLAKLAKVPSICAVTPPDKNGKIQPALLAAFELCGVDEIYSVGGPMAVAALAYGTRTIPAVSKIFGPGSAYTNEAKRQALGDVGIDILAGPSEVMIIADTTAHPQYVAADLLAQAEHGTGREKLFFIVPDKEFYNLVRRELLKQVKLYPEQEKLRAVLKTNTLAILENDLGPICRITNFVAPEHLELQVTRKSVEGMLKGINTAGAIFIGHMTPTAVGDFTAGPNHTLPTGRTGRFYSGLQITDFMRRTSIVEYDSIQLNKAAPVVQAFSKLEQLPLHGRSVDIRLERQ